MSQWARENPEEMARIAGLPQNQQVNAIASAIGRTHRHSISPYPLNVTVNKANQVFVDGKYLGYVDVVRNWGTDFLARCENGKPNKFFKTKTEAVKYLYK